MFDIGEFTIKIEGDKFSFLNDDDKWYEISESSLAYALIEEVIRLREKEDFESTKRYVESLYSAPDKETRAKILRELKENTNYFLHTK